MHFPFRTHSLARPSIWTQFVEFTAILLSAAMLPARRPLDVRWPAFQLLRVARLAWHCPVPSAPARYPARPSLVESGSRVGPVARPRPGRTVLVALLPMASIRLNRSRTWKDSPTWSMEAGHKLLTYLRFLLCSSLFPWRGAIRRVP